MKKDCYFADDELNLADADIIVSVVTVSKSKKYATIKRLFLFL